MKTLKKIGSLVLAICLCFSLCNVSAFAASSDDNSFNITVRGAADGETYSAYKIFDVTYSDEDSDGNVAYSYTIDFSSAWYGTVAAATDVFTLTLVTDTTTYIVTVNEGVEDDDIIALFTDAGVPEGATAAATAIAYDGEAYLDVTSSGAGYYYVTTSLGSLVIIDTTNPSQTIGEKNGIPTVSKWVHENTDPDNTWGHEDDASNADYILFEIEIDNINGAVNLVLHDSMDDELEIPDTTDFHMNAVVLYTSYGADGITLTEGTDYNVTVGECTVEGCELNCAFEIHFLRSFDDVDTTGYIEITYELLLDTENDEYTGDYEEIDNEAQISFGTTSFSTVVMAETFSFGFEIFKYTSAISGGNYSEVIVASFSNDNPAEAIPSDELYLMLVDENGNATYYATFDAYDEDNYIYIITGWVQTEEEASYISEPEYGSDEQTASFYVPTGMGIPDHVEIQLDEDPSNPDQETNNGAEIISASEYGVALANAVFEVSNANGQTAYFLYEDGLDIYLLEGWLDEDDVLPEGYTTSVTSGTDGMIYIEGLDAGTYTVTEITAPDGYNPLTGSVTVTIEATYDEDTGAMLTHTVTYIYGDVEGYGVVNIQNNTGSILPSTGGMGTTIFYVIGAVLVCGAAVLLITRRRMSRAA